jgi:protein SCO1/2
MKKNHFVIVFLLALGVTLGILLATIQREPVALQAATWFGDQARTLPAFELTDHDGHPFNPASMKGKWHLLFFGYTHCPDICPDTLQTLSDTLKQIDDPAVREQLQITFVSVDPERDTLELTREYVRYFGPTFVSARGPIDKVNVLTEALGILHYIDKGKDPVNYEVAHSGALTLIDPRGYYSAIFNSPHDSARIAHDLTAIITG